MGTPLISGRSQWPFARMSRAIMGNLASSLVASTRVPRSKPSSAALTVIGPRGVCGRGLDPALMRQVVIAPGIEHHERPEDLAMVAPPIKMLRDELSHRRRVEKAPVSHT